MLRPALALTRADGLDTPELLGARFGPDEFRRTLGRFATGITLVTASDEDGSIGLLVNAFTSVSLDPPLVAICPSRSSFTWSRMRACNVLGVNVLAAEHAAYVRRAAQRDADRFAGLDYELRDSGVPQVHSAIAFLECQIISEQPAGDHWIVVARVRELVVDGGREPLVFSDGRLGSFTSMAGQGK